MTLGNSKKKFGIVVAGVITAILILMALFLFIQPFSGKKPVTIGAIVSLSGYGEQMVDVSNGMKLALETINKHGGINEKPLEAGPIPAPQSSCLSKWRKKIDRYYIHPH